MRISDWSSDVCSSDLAARNAAQLHIGEAVGAIGLDLLHRARGQEAGGAADERNLAAIGEPGADADHILLGDADVDQPLGKAVAELAELGRSDRIIDHRDDERVGGGQVLDRADIGDVAIEQGEGSAQRSISSSSSRYAREYCETFVPP